MAKELEIEVYRATRGFPRDERFRSVDQLNRSSSSVSNNIAEAYYKKSVKDRVRILRNIVIPEAEETRTNLLRSAEKGFMTLVDAQNISEKYIALRKALFGYIKFLERRGGNNSLTHQL